MLYLIPFLHQTTTGYLLCCFFYRCILFHFYIKPQLRAMFPARISSCILFHFYIKPQHSRLGSYEAKGCILFHFYIKPQPCSVVYFGPPSCILFHFYIKPQHLFQKVFFDNVVSYSISTSNHNFEQGAPSILTLYLIPFLHQTTTALKTFLFPSSCILFHFYIKPQPVPNRGKRHLVVSYSISTSNHNLWRIRRYFQAHYHLNHILIFNGML